MHNKHSAREAYSRFENENLIFTQEDREQTLTRIRESKYKQRSRKSKLFSNFGPLIASCVVLIMSIGLLLPFVLSGNDKNLLIENNLSSTIRTESHFSILILGTNQEHRSEVNLLLTYNRKDNSLKQVLFPKNMYIDILDEDKDLIARDKLTHMTTYNTEADAAAETISNLMQVPVDYYAVIPIEKVYQLLEVRVLKEDINQQQLIEQLIRKVSRMDIVQLFEQSNTNIPKEIVDNVKDYHETISSETINLEEGSTGIWIDGAYFVEVDSMRLENTRKILKEHLRDDE
jgi:polyisoprenyl-teichoic acid--peptidoglycan teichoic acid transferase